MWNGMYQDLLDRAKERVKKDACMKSDDPSRLLYLEIDSSGVILKAGSLKIRDDMNCGQDKVPDNATLCPIVLGSKSLSSAEWSYSNIESEPLGTLHGLENHAENRDWEITGININVSAISTALNMLVCTSIEAIQVPTHEDGNLQKLKSYILQDRPHIKMN